MMEAPATSPALEVSSLHAGYDKDPVLFGVDVRVDVGEIVAVIGHNGAGKTTLLRAAHGLLPARQGTVHLFGADVTRHNTSERVKSGMAMVPEDDFVFPELTVAENLQVGGYQNPHSSTDDMLGDVYAQFPVLEERSRQRAGTMSGGERRMLSLGTALMAAPKLMLLDEPSLGLAPVLVEQVMETIRRIAAERSLSVLLVEQNVEHALRLAQRAYVVRGGRIVHSAPTSELGSGSDLFAYF